MSEDAHHPAIQLLLARMESNPEEFEEDQSYDLPTDTYSAAGRWANLIYRHSSYFSTSAAEAYRDKLALIRMDKFHRELMDELCNGDERRSAWENQRTARLAGTPTPGAAALKSIGSSVYNTMTAQQQMAAQQQTYLNKKAVK